MTDRSAERPVPALRWGAIAWLALALVLGGVATWEAAMRAQGLRAGDVDDSRNHWSVERRKVAAGAYDGVVIIGSSRILFDTDLAAWQEMTGLKPIQLALPGTNPRPFLGDFADDPDFAGLLVVGVTEDIFFTDWMGIPAFAGVREFWKTESPSQRFGHQIHLRLSQIFAFLDANYTLIKLIDQVQVPEREGVRSPYMDVWKIQENYADRQTFLWPRIESDARLREHARKVWGPFDGKPLDAAVVEKVIAEARANVAKIRARGGEVVFVRAPSAGEYLESEQRSAPRAEVWDRLLRETGAFGIHFEDYEDMRDLDVPEWSHLSRDSATRFTRAWVGVLLDESRWLQTHRAARDGA